MCVGPGFRGARARGPEEWGCKVRQRLSRGVSKKVSKYASEITPTYLTHLHASPRHVIPHGTPPTHGAPAPYLIPHGTRTPLQKLTGSRPSPPSAEARGGGEALERPLGGTQLGDHLELRPALRVDLGRLVEHMGRGLARDALEEGGGDARLRAAYEEAHDRLGRAVRDRPLHGGVVRDQDRAEQVDVEPA